jgi:hypothetical protein
VADYEDLYDDVTHAKNLIEAAVKLITPTLRELSGKQSQIDAAYQRICSGGLGLELVKCELEKIIDKANDDER